MSTSTERRKFVKKSLLGSIGLLAFGNILNASQFISNDNPAQERETYNYLKNNIGLQLYTIRDAMEKDPIEALKKVAAIGYKNLELAGYDSGKFYGFEPGEFKKIVTDLGMKIISSHCGVEVKGVDLDNAKKMADDHAQLGVLYCIQPWVTEDRRKTIESYQKMVADWNKIGELMKNVGIQFGYHNHNFEFDVVEGKIPFYDVYMKEMDKDLITMELDIYWTIKAGQDPVKIFHDYPKRFELFHMKDMEKSSEKFFAPVGEGSIDFKRILHERKKAGLKYMFVEQDDTRDNNPFECITLSYNNLIKNIL